MRLFSAFAILLWLFAAPAAAQTPEERAQLDWVLQRGRLLFDVDRAAWVTTDDLVERVGDLGRAGVRGWTVERDGNGYVVVYYTGEGEGRAALYRGRVENHRVVTAEVFPEGSRPALTAVQRRIADARDAVTRMEIRSCARSGLNLAVIPPDAAEAPMDFYVLMPQLREREYPFGGHSRATLSPTGDILSQRAFANTCLVIPVPGPGEEHPVGLGVTHLLDPIPTEIHVFLAIWTGLPIFVGTNEPDRVWRVHPDRIELIQGDRAPNM